MSATAKQPTLAELERSHSEALLKAGQAPAGSALREEWLKKADALLQAINARCEEMNPTPFA